MMPQPNCPCGSGRTLESCCAPFLSSQRLPDTAEALMRSRYTAFVQLNESYLLESWHPSTRPDVLNLQAQASVKWLGLKILRAQQGSVHEYQGLVEFIARYKIGGKAERLHETSLFVREGGRWYYLEGQRHEP